MKTLQKLTKEQIEGFIIGVQETTEQGNIIDARKNLQWTVTEIPCAWSIKVLWCKGITRFPKSNPMTDKDDVYHYDDNYIQVLTSQSKRKLCAEIVEVIEYINNVEFIED